MANSPKGPSKTKLVTDLKEAYDKLNLTLEKTKTLSKGIFDNMQGLAPGGTGNNGGGASSMSSANLPSFITPQDVMGGGNGSSSYSSKSSGWKSAAATMVGAGLTAATNAISSNDYIMNSAMSSRFGFFSGKGNQENVDYASSRFQSMSNAGTPTSNLDAANAASLGNSSGLMSGLSKYDRITNSAASISNIMPGVGLEGGMGAVASLNQGASVNKLRMIGINVRDQNGFMRDVESIARDLWKMLTTSKSGKGKITTEDLSFSLQAGNSLDMMLNQYFGSDAILRQAVISYMFQFAQEGGTALSYTTDEGKKSLLNTGADTSISQSAAKRQAAGYKVTNAYTGAGITGIKGANDFITNTSNFLADNNKLTAANAFVTATTAAETFSGAGNGGGGALIQGVISGTSDLVKQVAGLQTGLAALAATVAIGSVLTDIIGGNSSFGDVFGSGSGGSSGEVIRKPTESTSQWAVKLLTKLGAQPTAKNISAINSWAAAENTASSGYMGERNNPLNMKSTYGQAIAGHNSGIPVFETEEGGLAATAKQLLSNNKKGDQYYNILQDLLNSADTKTTLKDIVASPWAEDHYGGNITINVNGAKDAKATAKEVANHIENLKRIRKVKIH